MSNNLDIDQMVDTQNQKETTHNDANGQIDAALTEVLSCPVDNTNVKTLTATEFKRALFFDFVDDTPAPTRSVTITVPAAKRGLFLVTNSITTHSVTVTIASQPLSAPSIATGTGALLACDGTNVKQIVAID